MSAEQQSLFDLSPAPWELDDAGERLVAAVVFATGPSQQFDYLVPENLRGQVAPGQRVRAPLAAATGWPPAIASRSTTAPPGRGGSSRSTALSIASRC